MPISYKLVPQPGKIAGTTTICPPTLGVPGWDGAWLPATERYATPAPKALPNGGSGSLGDASRNSAFTLETDALQRVLWSKSDTARAVVPGTYATSQEWTALYVGRLWSGAASFMSTPGTALSLVGDVLYVVTGGGNLPITGAGAMATGIHALVVRRAGSTVHAWLDGKLLGSVTIATPATTTFFAVGSTNTGTEKVADVRVMLRPLTDAECLAASQDAARVYQAGV